MTLSEIGGIVAGVFAAGRFVYMVRRMKTDQNKMGKILKDHILLDEHRSNNKNLAILAMVPEDKKLAIAALLREEV